MGVLINVNELFKIERHKKLSWNLLNNKLLHSLSLLEKFHRFKTKIYFKNIF